MDFRTAYARLLLLIVVAYLLLAGGYLVATPPLEASDEYKHYPVVQYIQTELSLPTLDPENPGLWRQEAAQPPLYYLLMAAATSWVDSRDLPELHRLNPHAFIGNPNQIDNKNLVIHQPGREAFPWQGSVLAINLIRLLSIGLGAGTILLTARLGLLLFDPTVSLLAAALTAFNPMFLFVSAAVNNDSLAILLGTLGTYQLVRLWRDDPDPRDWRRYALLGLVLGLGVLTKLSLLGLVGLAVLALALLAWRRRDWRLLLFGGGAMLIAILLVSGWWFARNLNLYGDPTALDAFVAVQGTRDTPITWRGWIGEFGTLYRSFWGLFGGVNVAAPELFYSLCNAAALVGGIGAVLWTWRHRRRLPAGFWLLPAWAAIVLALLVRWNVISPAFQGRLLFPALGPLNVLWALGLLAWVKTGWRPALATAIATILLAAAAIMPWAVIRPAYALPEPLAAVPATARFGPLHFALPAQDGAAGEIALVGVDLAPVQRIMPGGDPLEITLYWQAVDSGARDLVSSVHLLGPGYQSVGSVNRFPASGMVPTSRWQPGQIWRDTYHVYAAQGFANPVRLTVSAGLYDPESDRALTAAGPDGRPIDLVSVGQARLDPVPAAPADAAVSLPVALADGIAFSGYGVDPRPAAPGDSVAVTLHWQATATPGRDYTVFVHLIDAAGRQVAGADGPPASGDLPTSWWRAGDQIEDSHTLILPPDLPGGNYQIAVGLYDPSTGARAPRVDGLGDSIVWELPVEAR